MGIIRRHCPEGPEAGPKSRAPKDLSLGVRLSWEFSMSVATEIVQGSERTGERHGIEQRDGARHGPEERHGTEERPGTEDRDGARWRGHRAAAVVLRAIVFLCPVSVAGFLGLLVSRSIPGTTLGADITRVV